MVYRCRSAFGHAMILMVMMILARGACSAVWRIARLDLEVGRRGEGGRGVVERGGRGGSA